MGLKMGASMARDRHTMGLGYEASNQGERA